MASRGRGARTKGHNFERKIANLLTDLTGLKWRRGLNQSRDGGAESADVVCEDNHPLADLLHFELKRMKRCNIRAALRQALEDIANQPNSKIPVIITKNDREEILVTMRLQDWLHFLEAWLEIDD